MKKGFTLIELLAVVAILAVLAIIFIPNTVKILKSNNMKLYKVKESQLVSAAKEYVYDPLFKAPTEGNATYITIGQLATGNYLAKILDTTSGNECVAYVKVTYVAENDYDFDPCIICNEYKTDKEFCSLEAYGSI